MTCSDPDCPHLGAVSELIPLGEHGSNSDTLVYPAPFDSYELERPKCGGTHFYDDDAHPEDIVYLQWFCGRWDCPACGPVFRDRWRDHLHATFDAVLDTGWPLHVATFPARSKWDTIYRRILRAAKRAGLPDPGYVQIQLPDRLVVFTDSPAFPEVNGDKAHRLLDEALDDLPMDCKRIFTSRTWKLPKRQKSSSLRYRGDTFDAPPVVDERAKALRLEVRTKFGTRRVTVPEHLGKVEVRAYLSGGRDPGGDLGVLRTPPLRT